MTTSAKPYRLNIPELLWHGGGNEHGKPDPVYSVDFHPTEPVLLTTGIDANVPPKGSVRLWKVNLEEDGQEFLVDLCDHQSVVNIARFSPCGRILASASEKQILIYTLPSNMKWEEVTEIRQLSRTFLCPSLSEVYDLDWAPDSSHIVIGALEGKAEIIRVNQRDSHIIPGHTSYVQGVSWDPLNKMIATYSCDRSCKIHQLKVKEGQTTKLAPRGHATIKMHNGFMQNIEIKASTDPNGAKDNTEAQIEQVMKGINLFADSNVPSFFRRLSFSPDGCLLVVPTGVHRNMTPPSSSGSNSGLKPIQQKIASSVAQQQHQQQQRSFATHIFARDQWATPCISLLGLDEASVAIRFCPKLFELVQYPVTSVNPAPKPLFEGTYRMVYAVVTVGSVFVYDTQHPHPLMKLAGIHYAPINDAAWTADGRVLVVCSSDGYLTFVRFQPNALGRVLADDAVPTVVKQSHPCVYNFISTVATESSTVVAATTTAVAGEGADAKDSSMEVEASSNITSTPNRPVSTEKDTNAVVEDLDISMDVDSPASLASPTAAVHSLHPDVEVKMDDMNAVAVSGQKKRKRIQPVQISTSLPSLASPVSAPVTAEMGDKMEVVVNSNQMEVDDLLADAASITNATVSSEVGNKQDAIVKTQKKRIAPVLLATSAANTVASTSSSTNN